MAEVIDAFLQLLIANEPENVGKILQSLKINITEWKRNRSKNIMKENNL
jgi:hypothetical protein